MSEPKLGDVVRLKSGGPVMTCDEVVVHVQPGTFWAGGVTRLRCRWFTGSEDFYEDFLPATLEVVDKADVPAPQPEA